MQRLLEFLTSLYWLALPQTIVENLLYADWSTAKRKNTLVSEFLRNLLGLNSVPFFVPMDSPWSAGEIHALLAKHGIKMWGVGWANGELFFRVRKQQAIWAQYVMLRAGVPLTHGLLASHSSLEKHPIQQVSSDKGMPHHEARKQAHRKQRARGQGILSAIDQFLNDIDSSLGG
ncbi:MAG: hypothetical protein GXP39_15490 [Chloroflexi bacterium]|nr:hypothetical protein [Chloroflexota bacterium]